MPIDEIDNIRYQPDFQGFLSSTLGDIKEKLQKMPRGFLSFLSKVSIKIQ